ncbi:hypothetical protein PIB30_027435 [Stylosanthes scabra]|uniref:Uncharacterized protein n=1 Tax=Stylosanthes scabra TaxID=79078 RepID=A0ABU6X8S8_9FABA|nr:hypothetical protein [Stylosanthes scabra]
MRRQTAAKLNQLAEMLQKSTYQQVQLQPQHQPQLPIPNLLPSQPLPNPKEGLNAINDKSESEEEAKDTNDEEAEQQLYELLLEMTGSKSEEDEDSGEILDFCEEFDSDYKKGDSDKERRSEGEWRNEVKTQNNKGEVFFVNTIFKEKKNEEELPTKCEDPGPCLVTCKIRRVDVPGCLCDPGACGNIMPHALYETLDLGPMKSTRDVFTTADSNIVSVAGVVFTTADSDGLPWKTIETFQITPLPKKKSRRLQEDNGRMRGKESAQIMMIEALIRELL